VAIDPVLLWDSTLVMTETLAALFTALALWALSAASRRPTATRMIVAGATIGLASLCRPTYLPWLGVCALVLPWFAEGWAGRLKVLVVYCAGALVVLSPWIVRNQIQYGHPITGTTHGGYTLLLGNNPWFYDYLRNGAWAAVWDSQEFDRWWITKASRATPEKEIQSDRLAYQVAGRMIRSQPVMFVYSCAVHVGWLWSPLPHGIAAGEGLGSRWARYLVGAGYVVEWLLVLVGLAMIFRRGRWLSTWGWGLQLVLVFTAVHAVYWSNIRMRAPLVPVIALAAAAGTAELLGRGLRRK
jgi:hypothetical protein